MRCPRWRPWGLLHLANRSVAKLSGGQRQMVLFAQLLMRQSPLMLLDEPVSALDLKHQVRLLDILLEQTRQRCCTTLTVLHDLNLALRYAHDVLLLEGGRCQFGPMADTLCQDTIARVWQVDCTAVPAQDGVLQYLFA